jgi:hypothetical protein
MIKTIPVLDPAPDKPNVSWYGIIALMAPIKDESNPFMVDTRYEIERIATRRIDHGFVFCWATASARVLGGIPLSFVFRLSSMFSIIAPGPLGVSSVAMVDIGIQSESSTVVAREKEEGWLEEHQGPPAWVLLHRGII